MIVLGLETSCDETGLALYDSELGLRGQVLYSQIKLHAEYGGVVPELASRDHVRKMIPLINQLLEQSGVQKNQIDAVAYTRGPGLMGALMTGALFGRTLAFALNKPAIGVHHMEGHMLAPLLSETPPEFPFVALLVSGGHTQLMAAHGIGQYELLGESIDDAAGEAFDKVARVVGLGYPGGPKVDKLAKEGKANIELPKTHFDEDTLDFSFSGIKTAVINLNHKNPNINKADLCASFQKNVTDTLIENVKKAVDKTKIKRIVLAGGVSANSYIRGKFLEFERDGIKVYMPDLKLCTDNAAMIASAGYYNFISGKRDKLDLNAVPNIQLGN